MKDWRIWCDPQEPVLILYPADIDKVKFEASDIVILV